ncbi:MAG TPA: thioredoxin family protein [Opitutaceae bacterium]|nr:thioredoxin family protein [Opitutaceae bacterium]
MKSQLNQLAVGFVWCAAASCLLANDNAKGKEPLRVSHGAEVTISELAVPGKYTVFDFYSDYCPPCRALKPELERIHAQRDDVALVVVDINRPNVRGIDWKSPVAKQYNLHSIPHLVIYDPSGKVLAEDKDHQPDARQYIQEHWSD